MVRPAVGEVQVTESKLNSIHPKLFKLNDFDDSRINQKSSGGRGSKNRKKRELTVLITGAVERKILGFIKMSTSPPETSISLAPV